MPPLTVRELGDYIREQRSAAQVSLRQLSRLAGVSNPYLSQIERGLRRPSVEILQQIAKALRISAEQLYVRAGILDERPPDSDVVPALLADAGLSERQKQVLVEIYESFRTENTSRAAAAGAAAAPGLPDPADDTAATTVPSRPEPPVAPAARPPRSADPLHPADLLHPADPLPPAVSTPTTRRRARGAAS